MSCNRMTFYNGNYDVPQYDNEVDKFWKHDYHVYLHEFHYPPFKINADNEADALDEAIDLAEELGWMGCFIENPTDYDYDTMTSGGNHGLVLSSENWLVAKL